MCRGHAAGQVQRERKILFVDLENAYNRDLINVVGR